MTPWLQNIIPSFKRPGKRGCVPTGDASSKTLIFSKIGAGAEVKIIDFN